MKAPLLSLLLLLPSGDPFAEGVRAYEEGRFRDAYEAFTEAEYAAGNAASAALLYNRALAALHVGELRAAEFSAEKSAARGGPEFAGLRDFLLGNAAFIACQRAEAEANLRDADPTSLGRAINHARTAGDFWQLAALSRPDWPAARRNVERALLKLEELEQQKAEAEANQAPKTEAEPKPPPEPDEPTEEIEQDPTLQEAPPELTPEEIGRLLEKLAQIENEKRTLREAWQRMRTANVENDW